MSSKDKKVEDLVVSYNFPPSTDVSGIILAKRIIEAGEKVDLLKVSLDDELDHDFESLVNEYINEKKSFEMSHDPNFLNGIKEYVEKGLETIEEFNKDYKSIKSRSWPLATHFLSFEYKLKNPDVFWKAEFSDPLLFNIYNEKRDFEDRDIKNQDYIDKVNCEIRKLNKEGDHNFPELEYGVNAFLLSEYLPFLFADEILFTNSNQREVMLKQFPFDVYDFVMKKSIVKRHPTLDESFYHVKDADIELDSDSINIGYFGTFIGKRHFEYIFYAFETLNHKFKDKIKFYLYVSDADFLKDLSKELEIANNIIVKDKLSLLEFLNVTTKFDVLLVNDSFTSDCFEINPYLPSKFSDYLGSNTDIWAICEESSVLNSFEVKYKSYLNDYDSCREILLEILNDKGLMDDADFKNEKEYLAHRFTSLNKLLESEHKRKNSNRQEVLKLRKEVKKLKKENKKLKEDKTKLNKENKKLSKKNKEILSSKSWKLTKPLRSLKSKKN